MNIKRVILFLFSMIFAFVAAFGAYVVLKDKSGSQETVKIETVEVLAATENINEAVVITDKMLTTVQIPKDLYKNDYITDKKEIVGRYSAQKIFVGEIINKYRIIGDYSDKLSRDLDFDKRAVSIYVDRYSGVSDLLKPGDTVDLYVFLPEKASGDEVIYPDLSKLILQDVTVLSVDQDTTGDTLPREETPDRYALTLEVFYKDIEKIVLAESIGYLKVALRPLGDETIFITDGAQWQDLLSNDGLHNNIKDKSSKTAKTEKTEKTESTTDSINNEPLENSNEAKTEKNNETSDTSTESINNVSNGTQNQTVKEDTKKTISSDDRYHVVKHGDTLMNIARTYYNDASKYKLIMEANNLSDPNHIVSGMKLVIPKE